MRIKILFEQNIQKQKFKPDFNPYCPLHSLTIIYFDGGIELEDRIEKMQESECYITVFLLRQLSSPKVFKIKSFSVKHSLQKDDVVLL